MPRCCWSGYPFSKLRAGSGPRQTHRHRCLAGHGLEPDQPLPELSAGLESGFLVRPEASGLLLVLLVQTLLPLVPPVLGLDDTLERRRGPRIKAKGTYRDPVPSSHRHFVKASGLRWLCLTLLVRHPWASSSLRPCCALTWRQHRRTTPALLGLFSVVTLLACNLGAEAGLPVRRASWCQKAHSTFADTLAAVRQCLWSQAHFPMSHAETQMGKIPKAYLPALLTPCVTPRDG